MPNKYTIQSVLISPDAWLFDATTASKIHDELQFTSPHEHRNTRHIVTMECEADNIDEAWRQFYGKVIEFVEAVTFQTSSYLAFHDWNHVITNNTQSLCLVASFERSLGTGLGLYSQEQVDDVHKIMAAAKQDSRFKDFLHCYRMAVMVDAPETQDAYEKYLLLACEAMAGEVDDDKGGKKYDRQRLKAIMGKDLHKYFFSSLDPQVGKTIRNANMHKGKSPNQKPSETIKLVNRLRNFVTKEYGLTDLPIIEEKNSPTRGLYRDDGGILLLQGEKVSEVLLKDIEDLNEYMKSALFKGLTLLNVSAEEGNALLKGM
jgi:hypothetical protein